MPSFFVILGRIQETRCGSVRFTQLGHRGALEDVMRSNVSAASGLVLSARRVRLADCPIGQRSLDFPSGERLLVISRNLRGSALTAAAGGVTADFGSDAIESVSAAASMGARKVTCKGSKGSNST